MLYQVRTRQIEDAIQVLEIAEINALTNCEEYSNQFGKTGYSNVHQSQLDEAFREVHKALLSMREALKRTDAIRRATCKT